MLCDSSTVDPDTDVAVADLLYPDHVTENSMVYYRDRYKWYYLSNHATDEVLIFKQMDSLEDSVQGKHVENRAPGAITITVHSVNAIASIGVPHASFKNPLTPAGEAPRQSIEVRAMVFYD